MKLGIIGSGVIVQEFLPALVNLEGVEVTAVQGTVETMDEVHTLCAANNIPNAVLNLEELCATGVDTVYVAVPNHLHFMYCKQILEKSLNVIVEKPMTSNLKEALVLEKLAKEKNCFIFEAITTLYLKNYQKIKEWLPQIGTIKIVQSQYSQYSRRYNAFCAGQTLPVFDPVKAGGALMDLNLYNLHFVLGLFGEPLSSRYYANIERGVDTSGLAILHYPEFQALCVAAKDSQGIVGAVIQGTKGCIKTSASPNIIGPVTLELNNGIKEEFNEGSVETRLIPEFTRFIQAINKRDFDFCYTMLDKSISVSSVQTQMRLDAEIHFPADVQEL